MGSLLVRWILLHETTCNAPVLDSGGLYKTCCLKSGSALSVLVHPEYGTTAAGIYSMDLGVGYGEHVDLPFLRLVLKYLVIAQ